MQAVFNFPPSVLHKQFYFVISVLKIIGHVNCDSNLESHCIIKLGCNFTFAFNIFSVFLRYFSTKYVKKSKKLKEILGFVKMILSALKKMAYNAKQHESSLICI
jgi:hypothetical protein